MWLCVWLSLRLQGARPVRLQPPLDAGALDRLDGLLIGGGDDIGATVHDAMPAPDVRIDPERDAMELQALDALWETDVPIMGICRGAQMMNVYLGGRLHQDIYARYQGVPRIRTPLPRKRVTLLSDTRLSEIVGDGGLVVNSLHHQSVDTLGSGLRIAAEDEWGIVQAIEHIGPRFRLGVQWHPEMLFYRAVHRRLFAAFVDAARATAAAEPAGAGAGAGASASAQSSES